MEMALYAISDLHLSLGIDKPMDIFGGRWVNYMQTLKAEWLETIRDDDFVVIPGDISWATYLKQAEDDFRMIDALPGRKIISKGNHDYWWTTVSKLMEFKEVNNFKTISFLHNNCFRFENTALCGTRGWKCPGDDDFDEEDDKLYKRELIRLELSLRNAIEMKVEDLLAIMHFPPFNSKRERSGFVELMMKYGVKKCIYGHLHGEGQRNAINGIRDGISFRLVSADYLKFKPLKIL
jgi:uncharacterized protein